MPVISEHGGLCCGVRHIHSFVGPAKKDAQDLKHRLEWVVQGRMTEVILNENQCLTKPRLLKALSDLGFVLVGRFINSSHGNTCYVFHHCDRRLPLNDLPFEWPGMVIDSSLRGDLPFPVDQRRRRRHQTDVDRNIQPIPHTKIISFYHNVYRSGRSDYAYSTIEGCRASAIRPIRIDRHDLFCDGTTEWVEGVEE